MRGVVLLFLLILIAGVVQAALQPWDDDENNYHTGELTIAVNENVTEHGKTIGLVGFSGSAVNVVVDDEVERVEPGEWTFIDGVYIDLLGILEETSSRKPSALLNYTMNFSCGNGACERLEGPDICCGDCGCLDPMICSDNRCITPGFDTCSVVSDCDDGNVCTYDKCEGTPKTCSYEDKSICKNDDRCCPDACGQHNDNDCGVPPECVIDEECDDSDNSTIDTCSSLTQLCKHEIIIQEVEKREPECREDSDCARFADTPCDVGFCDDEQECDVRSTDGCVYGEECVAVGDIRDDARCTQDGLFEKLPVIEPLISPEQYIPLSLIVIEIALIIMILIGRANVLTGE